MKIIEGMREATSRTITMELPPHASLSRWGWFRIRVAMLLLGNDLRDYVAARLSWGYWRRP